MLKLLFIITKTPASSKSPTRNSYPFLSLHNKVLCDLVRLWAPPILSVHLIEFLMPLSWHAGSWLLYFLIQVNYLIMFVFNLALGNPAVRDKNLIHITCLSGKLTFCYIKGEGHGTLTMTLSGGAYSYYFTMDLRTMPLKPWERQSASQEVRILQVSRSGIMQIPPTPAHPPSDLQIIPPGVPFHAPCPLCLYPLKRGEYCTSHRADGVTVLHHGSEEPLNEHQHHPFLVLPSICYLALYEKVCLFTWAIQGLDSPRTSPTNDQPLVPPSIQHPVLSLAIPQLPPMYQQESFAFTKVWNKVQMEIH